MRFDGSWKLHVPCQPLWRSPGVLQLGPTSRLILNDVPAALGDAVMLLNGPRTRQALLRLVPGLEPDWLDWLFNELHRAGMLRRGRRLSAPKIEVVGSERVAARIGKALLAAGISTISLPGQTSSVAGPPALTVVAGGSYEPDRTRIGRLLESRAPHLIVRLDPGKARVGPLVIPGETACLRCHDLFIGAQDQAWPRLLAQLCRLNAQTAPQLLSWAISTTVLQVRAFCDDTTPDSLGRIIEVGLRDHALRSFDITPHPDCGCVSLQD